MQTTVNSIENGPNSSNIESDWEKNNFVKMIINRILSPFYYTCTPYLLIFSSYLYFTNRGSIA